MEKGRRVELARAIRTKMRYAMNIGLDDDLPPPTALTLPSAPAEVGAWVPNWPAGVSDPNNAQVSTHDAATALYRHRVVF